MIKFSKINVFKIFDEIIIGRVRTPKGENEMKKLTYQGTIQP